MEFCKVIENRFSVREYDERAVEADVLQRILEVFRTSPTAKKQTTCKTCGYQGQGYA